MTSAPAMLDTYPADIGALGAEHRQVLLRVIEHTLECAQACTACADACLRESDVEDLRACIRLNLDCADICETTARVLSRHTGFDANLARATLEACAQACRSCGDECARHAAMHEHCRVCADACRRCEKACHELIAALGVMAA